MEQAKKRDHKIFITDIAIDKVPYVAVDELSRTLCEAIQNEHKEILRISQTKNDSNEVLTLMPINLKETPIRVLGNEFRVDPNTHPQAISLFSRSNRQEIMYLHNHPSTNSFSLVDIMAFISQGEISLLSVVTNQGEVYILYKSSKYDFSVSSELFKEIYMNYQAGVLEHGAAVKKFLKICMKGGVIYAESN
ncbi:MAG: hypothetical protein IKN43_09035 [Selenomonadaceae bacterium]|nr:hypothetical protein [Selenomonadaceae bacterium]